MAQRKANLDTDEMAGNTALQGRNITIKYSYQKNKSTKPRRNKSAFIIFSSDARSKGKLDQQEGLNSNDVMVKLAELWKNLSKEEREKYNQLAKKDKIRYQQELADYAKEYPNDAITNKTKNNHVKKPCSAYGIYLKERKAALKAEQPKLKMAEILKIVSHEWKNIDEKNKKIFQDKANLEKQISRNKLCEALMKDQGKNNNNTVSSVEPPLKKKRKASKTKMEDVKVEINVKTEPSLALDSKTSNVVSESLTKSDESVLFANALMMEQGDFQIKAEDSLLLDERQNSIGNFFQNPTLDLMIKSSLLIKDKDSSGKDSSGLLNFLNNSGLNNSGLNSSGQRAPNEVLADIISSFDRKISGMSLFEPSIYKIKSESRGSISQFLNTSSQSSKNSQQKARFLNDAIISALGNAEPVDSSLFDDPKIPQ